ncbi:MAG: DUF4054 domain-containing protein [Geminicoccaceae bacterium]
MARTTLADVQALLAPQNITIDDPNLTSILNTASGFVDEQLADVGLGDALLTEIEKYLAAHFTALREVKAGISSERADDASVTYTVGQVTNTDFLQSTHFGQVAIALDVSGTLGNAGRPKAAFCVL